MKSDIVRRILTWPFIWALAIPLVILDIVTEIYHQIGFRLLGIERVKRSKYFQNDRYKLKYLNFAEKIGCTYCGYANGWLAYASEIAARTEKFYCAIKHEKRQGMYKPKHHKEFHEYGDEKSYRSKNKK